MTHRLDVVAVGIEDVGAVVVGVVPAQSGCAVVGRACLERRRVERVDLCPAFRFERDVKASAHRLAGGFEEERRATAVLLAEPRGGFGELRQERESERCESSLVERLAPPVVGDGEADVVDHRSTRDSLLVHIGERYCRYVARPAASWERLRLDTERLRLRPPTLQDADALYPLFADPEVMGGLHRVAASTGEEARAMIEGGVGSWERDGVGPFLVATADGNRVVGQAGLMIFDTRGWVPSSWSAAGGYAQPELGWALIRSQWGRGYATEAAAAVLDWAHRSRSLDRLVSLISPDNVRSQGVAQRLGAAPAETVTQADSLGTRVVWRYPSA